MTTSRRLLVYSAIRLGIFAVVLGALLVLRVEPWIAAVAAAVIGFCVSYILFRRQRDAVAEGLRELRRSTPGDDDAAAENDAIDRRESSPER